MPDRCTASRFRPPGIAPHGSSCAGWTSSAVAEQVEGDDLILRLMLVPDSPGTTDLPQAFDRLRQIASPFAASGVGITAEAYQGLDVAAKMAFLNIEAKLRETSLDGSPLMSFVKGVSHVAVDRVFVLFDPGFEIANAACERFCRRARPQSAQEPSASAGSSR